jgi:uncharacterized protein YjcR
METRLNHKRGAPVGNQNARKHGLYSSTLTPPQICEFWNILNSGGVEPELVALRIKFASALRCAPGNRRVLMEASKLLTKWYRSKFNLDEQSSIALKKSVRAILETVTQKSIDFNGTNRG